MKPLPLAEVKPYLKDTDDTKPIHEYVKKFVELKQDEARIIISAVKALNNPKLKEAHLVKLADFLPRDLEDVNKVCADANLSEEEAKAILSITAKQ